MSISRRGFVKIATAAGGGLAVGFFLPSGFRAVQRMVHPEVVVEPGGGVEINAWLTIDSGGGVTVRCPHSELGQGAMTSVGLMIAEELDVPWENVRVVFADANRHIARNEEYRQMSTGKSMVVRSRHHYIMQAGASARERLRLAAANAWSVSRAEVTARQGVLSISGRSAGYGEFASAAALVSLPEEPEPKKPGDWWLLGRRVSRVDVRGKTDGSAIYPMDVRLPGMVYAAASVCPVRGGKLKRYDFEAIRRLPGVIAAVEFKGSRDMPRGGKDLASGVAVVADSFWRAKSALEEMPIEWDFGPHIAVSDASLDADAKRLLTAPGVNAKDIRGDANAVVSAARDVVSADYRRPYECHVPMSPPAAVADVKPGRVDLWTFTQNAANALRQAADQAGLSTSRVFVHATYQGGSFGAGSGGGADIVRQAVEVSKQVGRPVKLIWTREEEMTRAKARPRVWARFKAVLGEDRLPSALAVHAVGHLTERGIATIPYRIPNFRYAADSIKSNILVGSNRAPGFNNNTFMMEQFVDEMALAGGWDPLEWRIRLTEGNERWQRVLLKLKEVANYSTDLPKGTGMGIAAVEKNGTALAACATVDVSHTGALRVVKITVVANSGYVINPRAAEEQIKGCVAWELSHALHGGLRVEGGRIQNVNFDSYGLLRMPEMPDVECIFAMSEDGWWGGLGEVAVATTPPSVGNAIYAATGKRVRSTPIDAHDLSWA